MLGFTLRVRVGVSVKVIIKVRISSSILPYCRSSGPVRSLHFNPLPVIFDCILVLIGWKTCCFLCATVVMLYIKYHTAKDSSVVCTLELHSSILEACGHRLDD